MFSPDGRWVVTAGPSAAGVGSVLTARRLLLLRGHSRPLIGAAFAGREHGVIQNEAGSRVVMQDKKTLAEKGIS